MISKHQPLMFNTPRRLMVRVCAAAVGAGFQAFPHWLRTTWLLKRLSLLQHAVTNLCRILPYRYRLLMPSWIRPQCADLTICRLSHPIFISADLRGLPAAPASQLWHWYAGQRQESGPGYYDDGWCVPRHLQWRIDAELDVQRIEVRGAHREPCLVRIRPAALSTSFAVTSPWNGAGTS